MRVVFILPFIFLLALNSPAQEVSWQHWSSDVFDRASSENKLVYLHVGANWCHWCHVMEMETYTDPEVIAYLNAHFIAVEADQDNDAALGQRYRAYGWPALIIFNKDGEEVNKIAGFRNADTFLSILKKAVSSPVALESNQREFSRNRQTGDQWKERYYASLDTVNGGYNGPQKFVDEPTFQYAMLDRSDGRSRQWLDASVSGSYKLLDREWGGVYQYSTHYGWDSPHYEKLLNKQARYIRLYSIWGANSNRDEMLRSIGAVRSVLRYVSRFLTAPDGRFYTAQDADIVQGTKAHDYFGSSSEERYRRGVPRIDRNIYPDENGQMIEALVYAWALTGTDSLLQQAVHTFDIWQNYRKNDLYPHTENPDPAFLLNDQLSMASAAFALLQATGEARYATILKNDLNQMITRFYVDREIRPYLGELGLQTHDDLEFACDVLTRWATYGRYFGDRNTMAVCAEIYADVSPADRLQEAFAMPEFLLAEHSFRDDIGKAVIAGNEVERARLRRQAILLPDFHRCIEDIEKSELENLPEGSGAALYFCHNGRCEFPLYAEDIYLP